MIRLRSDSLLFETKAGDLVPCSAESVTLELIGDSVSFLDPHLVRQAAAAVLHFFREEQGRTHVSVGEFSAALARVLRGFGLVVKDSPPGPALPGGAGVDLRRLASESGQARELVFFARLRTELGNQLAQSPSILRFHGLRGCVKQIAGARRWSARCQELQDQIVDYLRRCFCHSTAVGRCTLVVR